MDWSSDTPIQSLPLSYIPPVGKHVLLSHVSLPQGNTHGNNVSGPSSLESTILNYSNG